MSNIILLSEIKETISNSFELLRYNWSWSRSRSREPEPELFWRLRLRLQLAQTGSKIGGSGSASGSTTLIQEGQPKWHFLSVTQRNC